MLKFSDCFSLHSPRKVPFWASPLGSHRLCDISTAYLGTSDTDSGVSTPTCSLSSPSQQMVSPTHLHKPKPGCQTWLVPPLTISHPGHQQVLSTQGPHFLKSSLTTVTPLTRAPSVASFPQASLLLPPPPPSPCSQLRLSPIGAQVRPPLPWGLSHAVALLRACLPSYA